MSNILRALEIAREVGACWYRPFNGDIIVSPNDEPRAVLRESYDEYSEDAVRDFYSRHSEHFIQHAWMGVSINGSLQLSVCYEEGQPS
jgi:hypothetical protein